MNDNEQIVLLDEQLRPIGSAPKRASHHSHTPLHLAFSCYLFNPEGKLLLTKRADSKKVWPNVWTNSFCGHPLPGESFTEAIKRRAAFELGITKINELRVMLPHYRYQTPPQNGIIENEFCPVFVAKTAADPRLNSDEVSEYRWVEWDQLPLEIEAEPHKFSYWLKDQLPRLSEKLADMP